mmetsp:Transcript_20575/g.50363  ORF Transcript_20575/g.50363 Transcript_20575/m.50363 type:complete len:287 (+) Transcript_20575:964-1824(+)
MTKVPGDLTISVSPFSVGHLAAMETLSLPPSTAMPRLIMASRIATAAAYMADASPGSFAAHIQLPSHLMSSRFVIRAEHMLVSISPTLMRAMAAGSMRVRLGRSPIAVAAPVRAKWLCAVTAASETGKCNGPTHCCWATRPVTERSTLVVRNRFEPTVMRRSTRSKASLQSAATQVRSALALVRGGGVWSTKVFCGKSPSTSSKSKSTTFICCSSSHSWMRPDPSTCPKNDGTTFSRAQSARKRSNESVRKMSPNCSWYSAPQISSAERDSSPTQISRKFTLAPAG